METSCYSGSSVAAGGQEPYLSQEPGLWHQPVPEKALEPSVHWSGLCAWGHRLCYFLALWPNELDNLLQTASFLTWTHAACCMCSLTCSGHCRKCFLRISMLLFSIVYQNSPGPLPSFSSFVLFSQENCWDWNLNLGIDLSSACQSSTCSVLSEWKINLKINLSLFHNF